MLHYYVPLKQITAVTSLRSVVCDNGKQVNRFKRVLWENVFFIIYLEIDHTLR